MDELVHVGVVGAEPESDDDELIKLMIVEDSPEYSVSVVVSHPRQTKLRKF